MEVGELARNVVFVEVPLELALAVELVVFEVADVALGDGLALGLEFDDEVTDAVPLTVLEVPIVDVAVGIHVYTATMVQVFLELAVVFLIFDLHRMELDASLRDLGLVLRGHRPLNNQLTTTFLLVLGEVALEVVLHNILVVIDEVGPLDRGDGAHALPHVVEEAALVD